jgi:hypothetical protein
VPADLIRRRVKNDAIAALWTTQFSKFRASPLESEGLATFPYAQLDTNTFSS